MPLLPGPSQVVSGSIPGSSSGSIFEHTLANSTAVSATTITLDRPPSGTMFFGTNNLLLLIGIGTTHCEIRRALAPVVGAVVTLDNRLWYAHSAAETVLISGSDTAPLAWWGGKIDGTSDDSDSIQAGVDQSSLYGTPWITGAGTNQATGIAVSITKRPIVITSNGHLRRLNAQADAAYVGAAALTAGFQSANHPISLASGAASTDTFTITQGFGGSGASAQDQVMLYAPPGGTLPGGISPGVVYYLVGALANVNVGTTYQVSATAGGAAVNITSDGTAILYQKLEGVGRPYLDDVQWNGNNVANMNGFRLGTQQPGKIIKIRADSCPGIGIWSSAISQQGRFENTQVDGCGIGYQLDGFGVFFDYANPEDCDTGMLVRGDANVIKDYHSERCGSRDVVFDIISGKSGRGTMFIGGFFSQAGATSGAAPFYINAGAGTVSFSVHGAYTQMSGTGNYLVYDNDLGNHVMSETMAGPNGFIGTLYKPSGGGTATLMDRLMVNKDGGFSWLRDTSSYQQKPQNSQTAPMFYAGTGAPSAGIGVNGDYYWRFDTPGTANQRIYVKSAGSWVGFA